jgi:hypothetical protein
MAKPKKDRKPPTKIRKAPEPNKGLVSYNLFLLPEEKIKGSEDKWLSPIVLEGKNRRTVAKEVRKNYQGRSWKLRVA